MKNEMTSLFAPKVKPQAAVAFPEPQATAASRTPPCVWQRDSIIEDYMLLARQYSESEDQILVGAFLPMISALLARNVYVNFGGRMFCNLYCVAAAQTGLRATIDLVTHIARSLLPEEALFSGVTSNQALFSEYLTHPDKLWLIDGDVILDNWARDPAGKGVARQALTLFDCPPWRESYLKHEKKEGKAIQEVPQTSTSILIGATPEGARFSELETRDGMRWRFNYYTSERFGRMIAWPLSYDSRQLTEFTRALEALKDLKGEMRLSPEAFELWKQLQMENRRKIEAVSGIDPASEIYGSVLASSPAKTLKLAMIFEVCRSLKDKTRNWQLIQADTLDLAARHEAYCVAANKGLDGTIIAPAPSPSGEANIDAINRELDRIRQERHRHCEPDPGYYCVPASEHLRGR
jgi:hypothetical protein